MIMISRRKFLISIRQHMMMIQQILLVLLITISNRCGCVCIYSFVPVSTTTSRCTNHHQHHHHRPTLSNSKLQSNTNRYEHHSNKMIHYSKSLLPTVRVSSSITKLQSKNYIDYEYIPPNYNDDDDDDDDDDYNNNVPIRRRQTTTKQRSKYGSKLLLPSIYPMDTPATLRGEAVRAALRSDRCIGWTIEQSQSQLTPLMMILSGDGTLPFLNSKFTKSFITTNSSGRYQSTCLLNAKGQLLDIVNIAVATNGNAAYIFPSISFSSSTTKSSPYDVVYNKLQQSIFRLDQVILQRPSNNIVFAFSLLSVNLSNIRTVYNTYIAPILSSSIKQSFTFPTTYNPNEYYKIPLDNDSSSDNTSSLSSYLLIVPSTMYLGQGNGIGPGYTFQFYGSPSAVSTGKSIWYQSLMSNPRGPIEIGLAELETLRIELGYPTYNNEILGHLREKSITITGKVPRPKHKIIPNVITEEEESITTESRQEQNDDDDAESDDNSNNNNYNQQSSLILTKLNSPPSPLELHVGTNQYIDYEKGCYLGQEGIASIVKNPRGPPRSLYQVVFDDEFNEYNDDDHDDDIGGSNGNPTRIPTVGDTLFVLGSNEQISVGTITSIAEPGSTGDPITIGLALIKRPDSIIKQMKSSNLQPPITTTMSLSSTRRDLDGIISPPSLDPLNGLEVIIGGTYTIGTLRSVPIKMYERQIRVDPSFSIFADTVPSFVDNIPSEIYSSKYDVFDWQQQQQQQQQQQRATEVVLDTLRPVDIPTQNSATIDDNSYIANDSTSDRNSDRDTVGGEMEKLQKELAKAEAEAAVAAAEAQRKAEKMELLKRQAQEALLRRKQQQKKE